MDALSGVRVLELGDGVAPSVAGMLLADFGADVVKVEPASGAASRVLAGFAVWNRGKRSVTVARPAGPQAGGPVGAAPGAGPGSAWLAASIAGADICILGAGQELADWGPAVAAGATSNTRLIVVRMPPYLAEGAPWAGGAESDALLAAHAGVSWRQASDDGAPVESVYPHMLYVQAAWAAACTIAALVERERSGWGQEVTVTGINAVMEACVSSLTTNPNAPDLNTAVGGVGRHPTYRPVRAADAWLACGALGGKFEARLLGILGIEDILDDPRLAGQTQNMLRPDVTGWAMEQVSAAFRARPRDHWLRELAAAGIPAGPLLDRDEWLDHPQVVANDLRVTVEDPGRGTVVMPGVPVCPTATPGRVRGPAPALGQHNGASAWPAHQDRPAGLAPLTAGPLSGFRVLNLGTFVATPYTGFLLSELGADVIKVEPLSGDPYRRSGFGVNRGMRSLAIDLATPDGIALLHRVVPHVDVVTDGLRPGVAGKLGVGYETLRAIRQDIITMSVAPFGVRGELAGSGGVDMVLQAMSGVMLAQGEDDAPVGNTIAIMDVTTAALSTFATALALYHRERTGEGQRVWDSLLGTSTFLGLGELARYDGRPPAVRGGTDFKGRDPLDRYYPVADGWIRVQAMDPGAVAAADLTRAGLAVADLTVGSLAAALAALTGEQAVAVCTAAGIPAVTARRLTAVFRDPGLTRSEFAHLRRADDGTIIATPGRYATFSRTQRQGPLTPPGIGEDTREVLQMAGLDPAGVQAAIDAKIVVAGGRSPLGLGQAYR
jgi:crotonobetainyl-CoA:carnitine CoA-transferase CaiB-like acyl-CoA transferase